MNWLVELLIEVASWPFRNRQDDRSVVGKSRLDEEADRLWKWVAVVALVMGIAVWLIFRK